MNEDPIDKAIDKSLGKAIDGVSSFFGAICMPAAEELGELVRDQVRYFRAKNLISIKEKIQTKVGELPSNAGNTSPKLLKVLINDASWEEDDTVQDLWAGLIAGEVKSSSCSDESIIYTEQLRSMSSYEAKLLKLIYSNDRVADLVYNSSGSEGEFISLTPIDISIVDMLNASPAPLDHIVQNRSHDQIINNPSDHLLAFGYIKPQLHSLSRRGLIGRWEQTSDYKENPVIRVDASSLGLDLYMRCSGYKLYPLETYIITRKHWRDSEGKKSSQSTRTA